MIPFYHVLMCREVCGEYLFSFFLPSDCSDRTQLFIMIFSQIQEVKLR